MKGHSCHESYHLEKSAFCHTVAAAIVSYEITEKARFSV